MGGGARRVKMDGLGGGDEDMEDLGEVGVVPRYCREEEEERESFPLVDRSVVP